MNKKQDLLDMELEEAETRRDSFLILNFYHYNGMATKHRGSFPKFSVGKFVTRSYKEIFSEISLEFKPSDWFRVVAVFYQPIRIQKLQRSLNLR